jgi:SAM-dependent methyltransferase
MIDIVARHYETLLAEHYTWMFGVPFRAKVDEQREALAGLGVGPGEHGAAIDLGSGPGFQSIALAELGFDRVVAIDTSQALLRELNANKGDLPTETVLADLRAFDGLTSPGSAEAIVCMGDTLTHLESIADVSNVLLKARDALQPGGLLLLTFRDLSIELIGLDRFLPIRDRCRSHHDLYAGVPVGGGCCERPCTCARGEGLDPAQEQLPKAAPPPGCARRRVEEPRTYDQEKRTIGPNARDRCGKISRLSESRYRPLSRLTAA